MTDQPQPIPAAVVDISDDSRVAFYASTRNGNARGVLVEITNPDGSILYVKFPREVAGDMVNELRGLDLW